MMLIKKDRLKLLKKAEFRQLVLEKHLILAVNMRCSFQFSRI
jgi:hypothetical protein